MDHTSDSTPTPQFISMTSHAFSTSPVSYISPSTFAPTTGNAMSLDGPLKVPRASGEDTWNLILVPESSEGDSKGTDWAMVESVGQWDARWG